MVIISQPLIFFFGRHARASSVTLSLMTSKESTSLVQRCSDFVSEHKRAIIIGTAAVAIAAGGAAYYASTSRRPGDSNGERKSRDNKKKTRRSPKKQKTVNDKDGPILEERAPKTVDQDGENVVSCHAWLG